MCNALAVDHHCGGVAGGLATSAIWMLLLLLIMMMMGRLAESKCLGKGRRQGAGRAIHEELA